jgi:L-serine dehydratase
LQKRWRTMTEAIERGVAAEGVLPGGLRLERRARTFNLRSRNTGNPPLARGARLGAYALAVAEENAAGAMIVTAPTCGACGVLPSVLRYCQETLDLSESDILKGLATAGLIGNLVKANGSISGAEVGCQGEIGTACAMASGAATWLMGGTPRQIEYAAEMGIEHHLGLTCDPVLGLVQIPCIERNAFAAMRALDCAEYALLSDGRHRIRFDDIVTVMLETGRDMNLAYRETARGGLAAVQARREASLERNATTEPSSL